MICRLAFQSVCSCHVMYVFQSETTLYVCLNVKELLARSTSEIWSLSDCNWTRTQNWPVWPNGLVFVYELSGSGFESSCGHLSFSALSAYASTLLIFFLGNFPSIRLVDQWKGKWKWYFTLGAVLWGQELVY